MTFIFVYLIEDNVIYTDSLHWNNTNKILETNSFLGSRGDQKNQNHTLLVSINMNLQCLSKHTYFDVHVDIFQISDSINGSFWLENVLITLGCKVLSPSSSDDSIPIWSSSGADWALVLFERCSVSRDRLVLSSVFIEASIQGISMVSLLRWNFRLFSVN